MQWGEKNGGRVVGKSGKEKIDWLLVGETATSSADSNGNKKKRRLLLCEFARYYQH